MFYFLCLDFKSAFMWAGSFMSPEDHTRCLTWTQIQSEIVSPPKAVYAVDDVD